MAFKKPYGSELFGRQWRPDISDKHFYYFAYGNNMLERLMTTFNPSAVKKCNAVLMDSVLVFKGYSAKWHGPTVSFKSCVGRDVWGVIYELPLKNYRDLNRQFQTFKGIHEPVTVFVMQEDFRVVACRTYKFIVIPTRISRIIEMPVPDPLPCATYLKFLVKAAKSAGVPDDYVRWLRELPHSGISIPKMEEELRVSGIQLIDPVDEQEYEEEEVEEEDDYDDTDDIISDEGEMEEQQSHTEPESSSRPKGVSFPN